METTINKKLNTLQIERAYCPNHQAMFAALRLVLGLPKIPVILDEGKK